MISGYSGFSLIILRNR